MLYYFSFDVMLTGLILSLSGLFILPNPDGSCLANSFYNSIAYQERSIEDTTQEKTTLFSGYLEQGKPKRPDNFLPRLLEEGHISFRAEVSTGIAENLVSKGGKVILVIRKYTLTYAGIKTYHYREKGRKGHAMAVIGYDDDYWYTIDYEGLNRVKRDTDSSFYYFE